MLSGASAVLWWTSERMYTVLCWIPALMLLSTACVATVARGITDSPNFTRIDGQTIVIAGGTSGVGKEVARQLLSRGCHVVLAADDVAEGRTVAEELERSVVGVARVDVLHVDVDSLESEPSFARRVIIYEKRHNKSLNQSQQATMESLAELQPPTDFNMPAKMGVSLDPVALSSAAAASAPATAAAASTPTMSTSKTDRSIPAHLTKIDPHIFNRMDQAALNQLAKLDPTVLAKLSTKTLNHLASLTADTLSKVDLEVLVRLDAYAQAEIRAAEALSKMDSVQLAELSKMGPNFLAKLALSTLAQLAKLDADTLSKLDHEMLAQLAERDQSKIKNMGEAYQRKLESSSQGSSSSMHPYKMASREESSNLAKLESQNLTKMNPAVAAHLTKLDPYIFSKLDHTTINEFLKMDVQELSKRDNAILYQLAKIDSQAMTNLLARLSQFVTLELRTLRPLDITMLNRLIEMNPMVINELDPSTLAQLIKWKVLRMQDTGAAAAAGIE